MNDDFDSACNQQQQEERHRREDEAIARGLRTLNDFRRENAAYDEQTRKFNERMNKHGNHRIR